MKEVITSRITLEIVNEDFENGLILYKTRTDGVLDKTQKSLSIKNMEFSLVDLAEIIAIIIAKTKEQEGADV